MHLAGLSLTGLGLAMPSDYICVYIYIYIYVAFYYCRYCRGYVYSVSHSCSQDFCVTVKTGSTVYIYTPTVQKYLNTLDFNALL